MNKQTIRDLAPAEVRGRRALVRVDFNVPLDGTRITDDTRIRAALPTLRALIEGGARIVLLSHLGRPKAKPEAKYSLAPVATRLAELLGKPVAFCAETDTDAARAATKALADGDVLLLENTRFLPGEEKNDPALSRSLARLGDFYVNDAFGTAHRAHASTAGVAAFLHPAVAGLLMDAELELARRRAREAEAALHRHPRRLEDLRQDRRHRGDAAEGRRHPRRRRDGVHVLQGDGAGDGHVARRAGPRQTWRRA